MEKDLKTKEQEKDKIFDMLSLQFDRQLRKSQLKLKSFKSTVNKILKSEDNDKPTATSLNIHFHSK